jgi:hypothetical protein
VPWRGPQYDGEVPTLGYHVLDLIREYLRVPSGPLAGQPLVLTDEQALFFLRWYALDPETGRYVYRRGVVRRSKGWGKSPGIAAPFAFVEFVGDVVFDGWDASGEPVGRPHLTPWVQIAAVSEDQTDNTFVALYEQLHNSPAIDEFDIDLGQTRIYRTGHPGSRIEPVTSSDGSREGQPITAAILDQTETWYRSNGGIRLAAVLRRNAGKMGGRTLETPNAHALGDGSVAEASYIAWEKGAPGILYDCREAPDVPHLDETPRLREALVHAYGDSVAWVDIDRLVAECQDPATDPDDARRWYLNQVRKSAGRAIDPHLWIALAAPDREVPAGEQIGVGFDGSISDDTTALVGCTRDGHLFVIRAWERPRDAQGRPLRDWRVPRREVHDEVARIFDRWRVGRMLCDPARWWTEIEAWQELYNDEAAGRMPVEACDTNSTRRFAPACDRFDVAIREQRVSHDGTQLLTTHVLNMAKRPVRGADLLDDGRQRFVFVKSGTGKIDAGVAAVLACEAAATMPEVAELDMANAVW